MPLDVFSKVAFLLIELLDAFFAEVSELFEALVQHWY